MRNVKHSETPLLKTPVGTAVTAVIGLVVAAASLLVFVLDLSVTPEFGSLIISFVVCGIGLTTGLIVLRRLVPRREPVSLFAAAPGALVKPAPPPEVRAEAGNRSQDCCKPGTEIQAEKAVGFVRSTHRHKTVSNYKAPESSGAVGFAIIIGVCLVLGGRLRGGWEFMSLAVPAGALVALALYWIRQRQNAGTSGYNIRVAGGVVLVISVIGLGVAMMPFHFLRDFLGLALCAGGAVALVLHWASRRQDSNRSFI